MLVLTRRKDERLSIDTAAGRITICVVRLDPGSVRLGIEAPEEMVILRAEVERRKDEPQLLRAG